MGKNYSIEDTIAKTWKINYYFNGYGKGRRMKTKSDTVKMYAKSLCSRYLYIFCFSYAPAEHLENRRVLL